ncbi:MAG: hypothetical protein ACRCTQ_00455, partial [Brevinemataceae bacterium]
MPYPFFNKNDLQVEIFSLDKEKFNSGPKTSLNFLYGDEPNDSYNHIAQLSDTLNDIDSSFDIPPIPSSELEPLSNSIPLDSNQFKFTEEPSFELTEHQTLSVSNKLKEFNSDLDQIFCDFDKEVSSTLHNLTNNSNNILSNKNETKTLNSLEEIFPYTTQLEENIPISSLDSDEAEQHTDTDLKHSINISDNFDPLSSDSDEAEQHIDTDLKHSINISGNLDSLSSDSDEAEQHIDTDLKHSINISDNLDALSLDSDEAEQHIDADLKHSINISDNLDALSLDSDEAEQHIDADLKYSINISDNLDALS